MVKNKVNQQIKAELKSYKTQQHSSEVTDADIPKQRSLRCQTSAKAKTEEETKAPTVTLISGET